MNGVELTRFGLQWAPRVVEALVVLLLGLATANAQLNPRPPQAELVPSVHGQWEGPFELAVGMWDGNPYLTNEIAHALILPPPQGNRSMERVVFVTKPGNLDCSGGQLTGLADQLFGRSYVWGTDRVNNVSQIPIPSNIPNYPNPLAGSLEFFCGGHASLKDGSFLWVGGTDYLNECALESRRAVAATIRPGACIRPIYRTGIWRARP